jgi:hypothetical protein
MRPVTWVMCSSHPVVGSSLCDWSKRAKGAPLQSFCPKGKIDWSRRREGEVMRQSCSSLFFKEQTWSIHLRGALSRIARCWVLV